MIRRLPRRRASRIWPMQLLTLCAPVWLRSSRLNQIWAPPSWSDQRFDEVLQFIAEFAQEFGIVPVALVGSLQVVECMHQRLGHERTAEPAEMPAVIG